MRFDNQFFSFIHHKTSYPSTIQLKALIKQQRRVLHCKWEVVDEITYPTNMALQELDGIIKDHILALVHSIWTKLEICSICFHFQFQVLCFLSTLFFKILQSPWSTIVELSLIGPKSHRITLIRYFIVWRMKRNSTPLLNIKTLLPLILHIITQKCFSNFNLLRTFRFEHALVLNAICWFL